VRALRDACVVRSRTVTAFLENCSTQEKQRLHADRL
jgi:hypothetical protein